MKNIYMVEDDEGIRELIQFLLTSENYSVKAFSNVKSFHKELPEATPDLFLLDIMLPDGNGLDLCKEIKANKETEKIPVVLMSAHANITSLEGADDFVAKPFDVDEFLQRIKKQLAEV